ncbi:MAG TPA: glycosyltransferase [Candidatus Binatia bacterium]|nr:glycosyltransferase [Candidatus Binatia bacterium]
MTNRIPHCPRQAFRPRAEGKFLFVGEEKFYVRGVTYGPFRPDSRGSQYHERDFVERDFAQMAASNINAIRTYTVPPAWLLDLAHQHGLRVMVGMPWEQHITFLDDNKRARDIQRRVCEGVRACAGHPAVLCYVIGNEIPTSIVRWHGRRRIEHFLEEMFWAAKGEDPGALFTYVNYPSTEYLQLPFVDLFCFNVFLESQDRLVRYLARLHSLAGDRPVILTEIGLDSLRHGEEKQAQVLDWQVRTTFAGGCAGAFLFNWTDEWHRGGYDIEDWKFGLTRRDRSAKPALETVGRAFAEIPFARDLSWPRISVVVCSYNGASTLRDCLGGLRRVRYPNFEVIVVDDGSTDATAAIVREFDVRLIRTGNRGLSAARNTGMEAATGEIVAYTDNDCRPDPEWLTYLAAAFQNSNHVGVGGANLAPPGDGPIAECVANAPGGPVHVLLSDEVAEHIPGCNMAFRKSSLEAIGGFDPQFRTAGDDVDVCWRLQEKGWTLGFSPAAMVWHHRRNSVRNYWKQQKGYGKAEALLERKWPEKYNAAGHVSWVGRVYANGHPRVLGWASRIYRGIWGTAPFQILYQQTPGMLQSLPLMPEWYLVVTVLALLTLLGAAWWPLFAAVPLLVLALGAPVVQAILAAERATFTNTPRSRLAEWKLRGLTAFLHLLQPLARLYGRVRWGLTPWRRRGAPGFALPCSRQFVMWSEEWQAPETRLQAVEHAIRAEGAVAPRGGDYDRWDLEVRGGLLGDARLLMATEEHDAGKQLIRFRVWPRCSTVGLVLIVLFAAISVAAAIDQDLDGCVFTSAIALLLALRAFHECKAAMAVVRRVLQPIEIVELAAEAEQPLPVPSGPASVDPVFPAAGRPAVYLSVAMAPPHDFPSPGK